MHLTAASIAVMLNILSAAAAVAAAGLWWKASVAVVSPDRTPTAGGWSEPTYSTTLEDGREMDLLKTVQAGSKWNAYAAKAAALAALAQGAATLLALQTAPS